MVSMSGEYQGQKHCQVTHQPSSAFIETDAPKDNQGKGESFSPTDLVGAALGTCMMTVMAIWAEQKQISLEGSRFQVEKEMQANPRKISRLSVKVHLPIALSLEQRQNLETVALNCPVKLSLHSSVEIPIQFTYN